MNLGALFRTAHAFGASFVFSVNANARIRDVNRADTSKTTEHVPYYAWPSITDMRLPEQCVLVGIEITDTAIELPRFRHPRNAAYVLGREKGSLSPAMLEQCRFVVKIPTKFSLNVGLAGALVMYDRMLTLGNFADRPVGGHRQTHQPDESS